MASIVFQFRVDDAELARFRETCEHYKLDHRDVFRELLTAYADKRITIHPATEQLTLFKEIYNVTGD